MVTERDGKSDKVQFTGQEPVYGRINPTPAEVLAVVFNSFTEPIPDNPQKIAQVLVEYRELSCLTPLFLNTEDDLRAEDRIAKLVHSFIATGKTSGNLLVSQHAPGTLEVKRGEPDLVKSNLPEHSPWASNVSMLLGSNCKNALQYQTDLIRKALQVSR